jgi:hypothetical protein
MIFSKTKCVGMAMTLACSTALAQPKTPTETQCRQMVSSMIQTLKSTKLETERDKKDAKLLLERIEKTLQDHRARGASECESLDALMQIATRQ